MARLAPADLLALWEHAYGRSPLERAIVIVTSLFPERSTREVLEWPVGFRDRQIARLRLAQFGRQVQSIAACPRCGERVEFEMDLRQCYALEGALPAPVELTLSEARWRLRPVRTVDLLAATGPDPAQSVLRCCLLPVDGQREGRDTEEISAEAPDRSTESDLFERLHGEHWTEVSRRLEEIDPEARIQLALECVGCSATWKATFDIAAIFWAELDAWSRRMLQEVHAIASRYGWSEDDILRMSPWRRRVYLGLVGAL